MLEPVPGRASGVGSWPGTDVVDAPRTTFGELPEPHVPYLPELPARGPGADMIGRAAALLVDMPVDLQPVGWRLVDRPGRDLARAQAWLRQDLDVLAEVADGYAGPLKMQAPGPWTLAAGALPAPARASLVDAGRLPRPRGSLAEGVARHVERGAPARPGRGGRRPARRAVAAGRAHRRPAHRERVRPAARRRGAGRRRRPRDRAGGGRGGRCRRDGRALLRRRAARRRARAHRRDGLSLDVARLGRAGWEAVAAPVEGGTGLWAGVVPTRGALPSVGAAADAVWAPWRGLGLDIGCWPSSS